MTRRRTTVSQGVACRGVNSVVWRRAARLSSPHAGCCSQAGSLSVIVVGGMVFDGGDVDVGGLHLGSCGGLGGGLSCGSISLPVPSPPIPPTSSSVHGSGSGAASWFQPSSCPCLPGLLPAPPDPFSRSFSPRSAAPK